MIPRIVWFAWLVLLLLPPVGAAAAPGSLQDYYAHKYDGWQAALYHRTIDRLFPSHTPQQKQQAYEETLSFSHVTYHSNGSHHMENNLALTHAYEPAIRRACERFGVPLPMALAILSWENSGSTGAVSFAACAGLGQLSDGAVHEAHREGAAISLCLDLAADALLLGNILGRAVFASPHVSPQHRALQHEARTFDLERRHRHECKLSGIRDERLLPDCNIEDSVAFMRVLLNAYDDRVDLAISAYHNGIRNTDDLLRDYLKRMDPALASFTGRERGPLYVALRRQAITYVTLWSDTRCREMLNGLRTMDGDVTNSSNRSEALGDESDIYLWKATAALAGFYANPTELGRLVAHYAGPQDEVETAGYRPGGKLVRYGKAQVTREMAGYLRSLQQRLQGASGKKAALAVQGGQDGASRRGLAVDVSAADPGALHSLLNQDWLFDRIYLTSLGGVWHVCLNPRYASSRETASR